MLILGTFFKLKTYTGMPTSHMENIYSDITFNCRFFKLKTYTGMPTSHMENIYSDITLNCRILR